MRCLAFESLNVGEDIAPLRPGHTLVIPKVHHKHISELPEEYAAALGLVVTRVAKALVKGSVTNNTSPRFGSFTRTIVLENPGLNVVGNQEYAQAVPHVRFQCLPAAGNFLLIFSFERSTTTSFPLRNLTPRETGASTKHWTLRLNKRCTRWSWKGGWSLTMILPKNSQIRYDANCLRQR